MARSGTLEAGRRHDEAPWPETRPRVLVRRPRLPGARAVVGALLVAVAVVGIYAAAVERRAAPAGAYVVAARAIHAGDTLSARDLTRTPVDLPASLRSHAFRDVSVLRGATALAPVAAGELVQSSQVIRKRGGSRSTEVSFPIEASRVGANLREGDRVDVIATFGTGLDAFSLVIARHVDVLSVSRPRTSLGGESTTVVLTVALPNRDDTLALAHATRVAQLGVVRTTGDPPRGDEQTRYSPADDTGRPATGP
jgi:Flp pilus assembly protein CpaB